MTLIAKSGYPSLATLQPGNEHRIAGNFFAAEIIEPGDACVIQTDGSVYKSFAATAPTGIEMIYVTENGYNYKQPPVITIDAPTGTAGGNVQATAEAVIDPLAGALQRIVITNPGAGYIVVPNVTITPVAEDTGVQAAAVATLNDDGFTAATMNKVDGFAATRCVIGDAVTLYDGVTLNYGAGLTPGPVYLSATVPGGLDTAPSIAAPVPIGKIFDATRIRLWHSTYTGQEGILANLGAILSAQQTDITAVKKTVKIPIVPGTDTAGALGVWQNPEAGAVFIKGSFIDVTTVAAGACTVDVGTTTVNATTDASNLISAGDVHSATGQVGTNTTLVKLAAGKWVTVSTHSGASAGLAGAVYIEYLLA